MKMFPTDAGMFIVAAFVVISILVGAGIASVAEWRRNRGSVYADRRDVTRRGPSPMFGPDLMIYRPHMAHPVGGVLALGLAAFLFVTLPKSRWFIVLSVFSGCVFGLVLWLRHR
jgi:hypothetical protein